MGARCLFAIRALLTLVLLPAAGTYERWRGGIYLHWNQYDAQLGAQEGLCYQVEVHFTRGAGRNPQTGTRGYAKSAL
jgi:hypothetical protein